MADISSDIYLLRQELLATRQKISMMMDAIDQRLARMEPFEPQLTSEEVQSQEDEFDRAFKSKYGI